MSNENLICQSVKDTLGNKTNKERKVVLKEITEKN